MKAAAFDYHAPTSIEAALGLLDSFGEAAKVMAGGQSLVPELNARLSTPDHVVDLNRLARAERPSVRAGRLRVPPLMRHIDFCAVDVEGPLGPLLRHVAREVSPLPIALRGTFCGTIAHADPAGEWCLLAVTLSADMLARSLGRGVRTIRADRFFATIMSTDLADDELLVEVQIPLLSEDACWGFYEVAPRAGTYPMATALAVYEQHEGRMASVRLGVGAVEAVPRRFAAAESLLEHQTPSRRLFRAAADAVADTVDPIADTPLDADHRRDLAHAAALRALERTLA